MFALARRLAPALDLLFPARCLGCRALGSYFCGACLATTRTLYEPFCPRCNVAVDMQVPLCRCNRPALGYVIAAAEYDGALRRAILQFKYKGQRAAASNLAALLAPRIAPLCSPDTCLVPVPLHRKRERSRGYNQSVLLARALSTMTGIALQERLLVRTRDTKKQVDLHGEARARNVAGAFAVPGTLPAFRHYVLIDDVCTTGATLSAAAVALRLAGAHRVIGGTVVATTPGHRR